MDCKIIIVTHNNDKHMTWLFNGLESSMSNLEVNIIDSGSDDTNYLYQIKTKHKLKIIEMDNVGFVKGNNLALDDIDDFNWVLFLNPDAMIDGKDLDKLIHFSERDSHGDFGVISVPLKRYNIQEKKSQGVYDSIGIECNFYGKWKDICSGEEIQGKTKCGEYNEVEAICGAFMLIKSDLLIKYTDMEGKRGFESSYYMYKEDIELSLRMRKNGFKNIIYNNISAFHCRGWNKKRKEVPYWAKYNSAKNDLDIGLRYKPRALPYAVLKYIWVKFKESKR